VSALVWLTWRQHRWTILGTTAFALLAAFALISTEMRAYGARLESMPLNGFYGLMAQLTFGAVIGSFWGAPLLARELEERTYFVAWGQDVTPEKWLRGKALVLGGLAVVLGAIIGIGDGFAGSHGTWDGFEASPFVQAGYAIFGFALGVLIGLLTRHVVTAMAATLVVYTVIRAVIAITVRDHYLPVERVVARWDGRPTPPAGALDLGGGFVGADLDPVPLTTVCERMPNPGSCMRAQKAAIGTYVDYQPIERQWIFQLIEAGVFALLAAVLFAVTFRVLRQGGGWKPTRRHRRIDTSATDQSAPEAAAVHAEG
jgi:hypothetical protein